jgi:[acyl-carrier-protein] S-malonyltransferase
MTKTAWVFPGQGSQAIGMGVDLQELPQAQAFFQKAEDILGWSVLEMCQSDEEKLSYTPYTQPCLYVVESILAELMRDRGYQPQLVAGHSLGEYVALYVAGVFSFEDGLALVKRRSELMNTAPEGQMDALMGFQREELEQAVAQIPDVVIANDNSAVQVVVSGTPAAIQQLKASIKIKRAVTLKVSRAFHSPFMATAEAEYGEVLASVPFTDAQVPVLSNVDPIPATKAEILKARLMAQMTGSVRWRETSLQLAAEGIEEAIEIGPGNALTGLIKRTCPDIALKNIHRAADLLPSLSVTVGAKHKA